MSDHRENIDGVGVHGRLLASFPSIEVDLGTGMLAQMGVKQRIALRSPISSAHYQQGDERLLMTLIARQNKAITATRADYSFQPAVTIDMHDERLGQSFRASAITDAMAQEHGYATGGDMRKSLQLAEGEDPVLFSYGIRVARPAEMITEDSDKAGTYLNARRDATFRVWNELQNEKTVRWATNYLETLPEEEKLRAIALITPREHLNGLAAYAPDGTFDLAKNNERPLPQDVAVLRGLPPEALPAPRPAAKKPSREPRPREGKLVGGEGWELMTYPDKTPGKKKPDTAAEKPEDNTAPKPAIRTHGVRTARLQRAAAEANVTKNEAKDGFDGVNPALQDGGRLTREITRFAAEEEARVRRLQPRKKVMKPVGDDEGPLKSRGGRG